MDSVIVNPNPQYGHTQMGRELHQLQAKYPFLHVDSIGRSVESRELCVVRLGTGPKEVFYHGAIHANEWITAILLMKFIEDYARAYQENTNLLGCDPRALSDETAIWVLPMANPDGVELVTQGIKPNNPYYERVLAANNGSTDFARWKANIRGVDLNDQFPAHHEAERTRSGITRPYFHDYGGPSPFSEPESKAIANFTYAHNFRLVLAIHTQGEVLYWGYRGLEPSNSKLIVEKMQALSGYLPIRNAGSDAGYRDWFIQKWRRPGFTIEVGHGNNPLPLSQFAEIYPKLLPILLYAANL